jgi:hypothetical protein
MPIVLFWLTPVLLLVVVILLFLQEQQKDKPKLMLIDPFLVLESLQIARIIGDEKGVYDELAMLRRVLPNSDAYLERVIRLLNPIMPRRYSKPRLLKYVLHSEFLIEYRYEYAGRITSVLFGRLDEVAEMAQDYVNLEQFKTSQERADHEGFATFALARRIDAKLIEGKRTYRILGQLIVEPELNLGRLSKIRLAVGGGKYLFLSWLDLGVSTKIAEAVFPVAQFVGASATATRQLPPKDREAVFERATIYANTTLNDRYEIVQFWRHRAEPIFIGASANDRDHLPCRHVPL